MFKLLLTEIRIKKYSLILGITLITFLCSVENSPHKICPPIYNWLASSMSLFAMFSTLIYFFFGTQDCIFLYSRIKLKWYKLAPIRMILPVLYFSTIIALTLALEYIFGFKLFSDIRLASIFISNGFLWWTFFTIAMDMNRQKKVQEKRLIWKNIITILTPATCAILYSKYFGAFLDPYIFDLRSLDTPTSAAIMLCAAIALASISLYINRLRLAKSRAINIKD